MNEISVEVLRDIISYDAQLGLLVWKARSADYFSDRATPNQVATWNTKFAGQECGRIEKHGYRIVGIFHKTFKAHRVAWALHYGSWPKGIIDHINGVKGDNRIENLRLASPAQNSRNRAPQARARSGYKGVSFHRASNKWEVRIMVDGKRKCLGTFSCRHEAARCYNEHAAKFFGQHARLNDVPSQGA